MADVYENNRKAANETEKYRNRCRLKLWSVGYGKSGEKPVPEERWSLGGKVYFGRDENGKAKYSYIYGKSEHEVEAILIEKKAEIKAAERAGRTLFADLVEIWLVERRSELTEASADRYEYLIRKYIIPEFGEREADSVNLLQMNTYIADLGDRKKHGDEAVAASTLQSLQSISTSILNYITNRDKNIPNPYQMKKDERNPYQLLTSEEIRKLIACAKYNKSTEMLGVMLCLFSGVGTGEICALSWDDFDLRRREVSITHTLY